MGLLDAIFGNSRPPAGYDTRGYDQRKRDEARERDLAGTPIRCNDRTDFPPEQPRTCPPGQCIPSRQTTTSAGDVVSAAAGAASLVMGMLNYETLGYHDLRDEEQDRWGVAADRRRAGEAAYREQQELIARSLAREDELASLLGQLSDTERGIYLTHMEANALQPGCDTLTPMNLRRDASGQVVKARELQPVESKRRLK